MLKCASYILVFLLCFRVGGFSLLGHGDMFGWGVFPFGTQQIDIGAGGPFWKKRKKRPCSSKWDFGEIDFTNDRLKLKINVNPTSWDYSRPFEQ